MPRLIDPHIDVEISHLDAPLYRVNCHQSAHAQRDLCTGSQGKSRHKRSPGTGGNGYEEHSFTVFGRAAGQGGNDPSAAPFWFHAH